MSTRPCSLAPIVPLLAMALLAAGCGAGAEGGDDAQTSALGGSAASNGQMSADFRAWLLANGYGQYNFPRDDVHGGSFGGRATHGQALKHTPIIFVHGNADSALGTGTSAAYTGFAASVAYFKAHGYTAAELYGTTWGPASILQTASQEHSRDQVLAQRAFLEAVLAYTGAAKVDVIAHSMGVTLARGAILGGRQVDTKGTYSVGAALGAKVDTFIGISGGNLGLSTCYYFPTTATCSAVDGFYPGNYLFGSVSGLSSYLAKLNALAGNEGSYRFSIWSHVDEVLGGGDLVWGAPTSRLLNQTAEVTYSAAPYGHVGVKDLTGAVQLSLVTRHTPR